MKMFTPSLEERKRIHSTLCKQNPKWKSRMALRTFLLILTVAILVFAIVITLIYSKATINSIILILVGLGIASIPFIISLSVNNTAKYVCAFPYSSFANGILTLEDDLLEYTFWRVGSREPAAYSSKDAVFIEEDRFVYTINKDAVKQISIENDICTLTGSGTIKIPKWAEEDTEIKKKNNCFSFVMAFEQKDVDQAINEWRK